MQINANPFPYNFDVARTALVIIDMQRDFIEPGGFGESLGNEVALLAAIVPACQRVLQAWRESGGMIVHTRLYVVKSKNNAITACIGRARWGG